MIFKRIKQSYLEAKRQRDVREGKTTEEPGVNQESQSVAFIQRRIRGILARKHVDRMRDEEMEFLGMTKKKKTAEEIRNDPIKKMADTYKDRKLE